MTDLKTILHIGMHKTGSTQIQAFIAVNRPALLRQGIDFPEVDGKTSPKGHIQISHHIRTGQPAGVPEDLARRHRHAPAAILSCENFSQFDTPQVDGLCALVGPEARAVGYFRDPVSHVASMYRQGLKGKRNARSLPGFVDRAVKQLRDPDAISRYCYDRIEAIWRERFAAVAFAPYARMDATALMRSFFELADLPVDPGQEGFRMPENRSNAALSDRISYALYNLNVLFRRGRIPQTQRDAFLACVQHDQAPALAFFADCDFREIEVDTVALVAAFRDRNPVWSQRLATEPVPLRFSGGLGEGEDRFLARVEAATEASAAA